METTIKKININDIKISNPIRRNDKITKSFLDSLKYGNVYPIVVTRDLTLIDGKRRLLSLKERGIRTTTVIVAEADKDELEIVLNVQRKDLDPIELAEALKKFIDKQKISQRRAARILGLSKSMVEYHVKLLELPEEVKEELRNGRVKPYSKPIERQYRKRLKTPNQFKKSMGVSQYQSLVNRLISFREYLKSSSLGITDYARIKELLNEIMNIVDIKLAAPPTPSGQVKHEDFNMLLGMKLKKTKYEKRKGRLGNAGT